MLEVFFRRLKHTNPKMRYSAARELGCLEDECALEPLHAALKIETNAQVHSVMKAAIKRIEEAARARTQQPKRPRSELEENQLAARIVDEASMSSYTPPSASEILTKAARSGLMFGGIGTIGMLHGQANEMRRGHQLDETLRQNRKHTLMEMNARHPDEGEGSDADDTDTTKSESGFVLKRLEPKSPDEDSENSSIIRRIEPRKQDQE